MHDLPSNQAGGGECRYEVYKGLNRLWRGYVREVLGLGGRNPSARDRDEGRGEAKAKQISAQHHGAVLASLDFHGAELEVVRCGCVGRVGTKGVVVRDTKFTFVVVTERDVVRSESSPCVPPPWLFCPSSQSEIKDIWKSADA